MSAPSPSSFADKGSAEGSTCKDGDVVTRLILNDSLCDIPSLRCHSQTVSLSPADASHCPSGLKLSDQATIPEGRPWPVAIVTSESNTGKVVSIEQKK